jgi:hypothetical protein
VKGYDQVDHGQHAYLAQQAVDANVRARSVQVMSTLPLKALSRLWGRFNEIDIPYYLRVPGFKLYSFIFGVKSVPNRHPST